MTTRRWMGLVNAAAVVFGAWMIADSVNAVAAARMGPAMAAPPSRSLSLASRNKIEPIATYLDPIVGRNVFNHGEPVPGMEKTDLPDVPLDLPAEACTLPIKVLSVVIVPSDPSLSIATMLDSRSTPPGLLIAQVGEQVGSLESGSSARIHRVYEAYEPGMLSPAAIVELMREDGRLEHCRSDDEAPPAVARSVSGRTIASSGEGIKKIDEKNYVVAQAEIDKAMSGGLAHEARNVLVVPYFEGGENKGFKFSRIKPNSILSKVGLRSGDIIRKVNGYEINSPEKALQIYAMLKNEKNVSIDLTRAGSNTTLNYSIR